MVWGTPDAEVHIDEALLAGLLADQHPDLARLPVRLIDAGWDNSMFRLGDALSVRMPRRQIAVALLANEQRWLPDMADVLPLPVPALIRPGAPGRGYPWAWSILPWLDGIAADQEPPAPTEAPRLAAFLTVLHQPAPLQAPANPGRGVPLIERDEVLQARLERLRTRTSLIGGEIDSLWRRALAATPATDRLWLHGDLHARNILVKDGAFSGVIDWGDITAGDPATDLAAVWGLFEDAGARDKALAAYGPNEALIARAKGWAVLFGAMLLDSGLVDNPRHAAMGAATLRRVAADG